MAEDSDYSLFKKATQAVSQGTVGDPATSMIDAPGSLGGILPVRLEKKEPSEPAITGEREVTFSKPFAGAAFIETYKNVIDHSKVTPIVTIEEAYQTKGIDTESDTFRSTIMEATGFTYKDMDGKRNEQGEYPTKRATFLGPDSYETRMQKLNAGKALNLDFSVTDQMGQTRSFSQPIPYSSITEQYTTTPKDLNDYVVNMNPFSDRPVEERTKWDFFVGMTKDNEALNVMMAQNMVETLKNNGFSDRNIAGIMKHRMSLPTAGGFGAGDISNFRGVYTDIARFPFEAAGYLLTEAFDATVIPGDFFTPEGREEWLERFLPRMPGLIVNRYDQLNLDIDYHQAERLSRMFSGVGTKSVALAAEVTAGTSAAKGVKYVAGKKEIQNFKLFEKNHRAKFPNSSEDEILTAYSDMRRSQLGITFNSSVIHDKILNVPVVGGAVSSVVDGVSTVTAKINGLRTSSALKAGFDIEEAALSVKQRPEVRKFISFRNQKRSEITGIHNSASNESRSLTQKEAERVANLRMDISRTERDLRRIVADSSTPRFMRDSKTLDAAVILGGATAYTTAQAHGGDEMFWEFVGSMSGMSLYGISKGAGTAVDITKRMIVGRQGISSTRELIQAEKLAANLANFDDTFREGVLERVRYFNGLTDSLRSEGISSSLLERSASNIINLAVLQTLEEGMRVSLDAPSTAEFKGIMQTLELNRSSQQELIGELRGLFAQMSKNPNAAADGTATNKLFTTVQAAIENAEGKIQQLDADLGVLNRNYENVVLGMIEGTPLGTTARISPGAEKSMATTFDNLNGYNIETLTEGQAAKMRVDISEKTNKVVDSINAQAQQTVTNALPTTTERAKDTVISVMGVAPERELQVPKGADLAGGLPKFKKPGDLLALLMESSYSADKANAAIPYKELNSQIFRMVDGQGNEVPVNGAAFSDGGNILDMIVAASKGEDNAEFLVAMNPDAVNMSPLGKIVTTLNESAKSVISQVASQKGIEPSKFIQSVVEKAARDGEPLTKDVPLPVAVVNYMRQEAQRRGGNLEVLPLNFVQLRELQQASGNLAASAQRSGKGGAMSTYLGIKSGAETAFDRFTVITPDGQRIPANNLVATITMPDGTRRDMTVRQGVEMANAGWTALMSKYQDNPLIRTWMGFRDFTNGARVSVDATADNPLGMTFGKNKPNTWIDIKAWSRKSTSDQQNDLTSLANVIGEAQPDGSMVINIDSSKGQAFKSILEANYREFVLDALERGDMAVDEFETVSRNFEKAFVGVNNAGTQVRMINTEKAFGKLLNFSEGSVGKANYEKGVSMVKNAAKEEAARVKTEVAVVRRGLDQSVRFLQNFTSDRVDAENLASNLISGGSTRLIQLKKHLKEAGGMNDDEVATVLRSVLTEALEVKAFKATNVYIPMVGQGRVVQKFEMDLNEVNNILGVNNPDVAKVVKDIVGDKAYQTYMDVLSFMSEQNSQIKSEGVRFTGVPRDFSVESYISRFYAVNRGVVSLRYVGTEAILQQMRNSNMSLLTQMISNPRVGELFMEMVRTGRPLPREKDKELFQMLVVGYERYMATHEGSEEALKIIPMFEQQETGHEFKYTRKGGYQSLDDFKPLVP